MQVIVIGRSNRLASIQSSQHFASQVTSQVYWKVRFVWSLEHLNPVVAEVDDVDEALVRDGDATRTVELARLFPVAAELSKEYAVTWEDLKFIFIVRHWKRVKDPFHGHAGKPS